MQRLYRLRREYFGSGTRSDTQPVNGGPAGGDLTPERVAAYIAKYATKSAEDFGLGDRRTTPDGARLLGVTDHVARIVDTCWQVGGTDAYEGLRRWLHMIGFRGHFASKSRRYSTTLGAIRTERRTYRQRQAVAASAGGTRELVGQADGDTTLVVARWEFAGLGYLTPGDAALALPAAVRARPRRDAARDARSRQPPRGPNRTQPSLEVGGSPDDGDHGGAGPAPCR